MVDLSHIYDNRQHLPLGAVLEMSNRELINDPGHAIYIILS